MQPMTPITTLNTTVDITTGDRSAIPKKHTTLQHTRSETCMSKYSLFLTILYYTREGGRMFQRPGNKTEGPALVPGWSSG